MPARVPHSAFIALSIALLSACGEEAAEPVSEILTEDPQLARALNDPLMVDPDLSWRSEANAVIAYRDGHPLPLIEAREDSAARAREAMRLELLEGGQIPALPPVSGGSGSRSIADLDTARDIVEAVGSRTDCITRLDGSLLWSTRMPPTSSIMPHGMIQQAAGVDEGTCVIRIVRYLTPAGIESALEYHAAKVQRARFDLTRFAQPANQLIAERRDQKMVIEVGEGPNGMTAVDVIHWRK